MLLTNFYKIQTSETLEDNSFETIIVLQNEHPIFNGHFPNFPVTPGVAMLQIIKELTENQLQQSLFLKSASNVKFLSLVDPNKNAILNFSITLEEDHEHVKVKNTTSFTDGMPVLKCYITFDKR
ncbi:3-hydroxyacyl-ACP dehydratase [Gelidibacter maritimus]|uniref:3-hydroxyacyl-ACP dehydratase n=1 Tax=Gelidibacter maritimus TaxID=2761487 RepID=A0A7W2M733_9FLAO|nr:3-hydroxyacyl-ACP dehydratase [Gelidibacter maritimus]MBA6153889.1 3-hydroxyacyl-ACP dehydratase [Gelidibacter maritimus]